MGVSRKTAHPVILEPGQWRSRPEATRKMGAIMLKKALLAIAIALLSLQAAPTEASKGSGYKEFVRQQAERAAALAYFMKSHGPRPY